MDDNTPLVALAALAAVFATAAISHLMVALSRREAREHFWFGLGSLAAAGATAAWCVPADAALPTLVAARGGSIVLSAAWLVAMLWFTVELADSDARERRIAAVLSAVSGAALLGFLVVLPGWEGMRVTVVRGVAHLFALFALLGLLGLAVHGALRLWRSQQNFRAVTLGAGMGIAVVSLCWHYTTVGFAASGIRLPPPYGFLPLVLLMAYDLARSVAKLHALLTIERIGQAHVSRLAVVGELTASLAHEINQPLGAILSNADAGELILERNQGAVDEVRQILGDIRRDAVRAGNVIRSVRTLVRNEPFEMIRLDANLLGQEVLSLVAADARARGIDLGFSPAPDAAWIRGDRTRLEQVLLNLLMNAMDASEAAATLEGTRGDWRPVGVAVLRNDRGEVEISVSDEGTGIPPERLANLFDSFHTTKAHGMGLGLSIARSMVEAHGGSLSASNNARKGASFRATLPPFEA